MVLAIALSLRVPLSFLFHIGCVMLLFSFMNFLWDSKIMLEGTQSAWQVDVLHPRKMKS